MKLFSFIKWQWNKFEFWQKLWMVGAAFFGAGLASPDHIRPYLIAVPVCIILGSTLKWFLWDSVFNSWKEFQKEQQSLFEKIKNSDKA